ncbi:nuclear transport factor 2 family protein [Streptomyces sp. TRM 70361]|uniref:nuclear transport factor 2 family protein n=1 Tax=Streptomyces sp. TRM 70361 TaxID=3116553 RepID=UPI002E7BB1AA|nr:nuclear transport factor 2 family protein [Streptomyces sp. TRM 70361]MEE1938253.1 nuclear transport factor 2 family protein [Streptomyces sp. TRM 70361]
MTQNPTSLNPTDLPEAITRYLTGRADKNVSAATSAFAPHATVTDDGHTYEGAEAITRWLGQTDTEYTYTTTLTGAERDAPDRYTVHQHLEGNFPGGKVDLRCRFVLTHGLISELSIAP